MSAFEGEEPLSGRLSRAVAAVREEDVPVLPLERALSRARALEPKAPKSASNGRGETWRNRISSLFDQLEDRDLLCAAAVCCVAPPEPPVTTASTERHLVSSATPSRRKRQVEVPEPLSCLAAEVVLTEALAGFWGEEKEEFEVATPAGNWIATSTACVDFAWPT